MMSRLDLSLGGALVLVTMLLCTSPAAACTCTTEPTPTENLHSADAVFTGTVLEVTALPADSVEEEELLVSVEVQRSWKGITVKQLTLTTAAASSMCGYTGFEKEHEYLIYAVEDGNGKLWTHICTRTRPLSQAQDDLVELGPSTVLATENPSFGAVKGRFDP